MSPPGFHRLPCVPGYGWADPYSFHHRFAKDYLIGGRDLASLADLMGHESVETTKSFYAVFEQDDLRRKHDHFSAARWET
jgi:site-specific recombinase XerD